MLPLKDNVPTRHFPVVTVALILANALVWLLYEDAGQGGGFESAVAESAYHPCEIESTCVLPDGSAVAQIGYDWPLNLFTSMFMHGSWDHLIGNMLFLWIFGNNVEDTLGRLRFLVFYLGGGVAATALQTFVTLGFGTAESASIPNLGASGAISAVLGAYILLLPRGRVLTLVPPFFFFEIPALFFLGFWFLLQLFVGGQSFVHPEAGGGIAYFAHIGGFVFGFLLIKLFAVGRPRPLRPSY